MAELISLKQVAVRLYQSTTPITQIELRSLGDITIAHGMLRMTRLSGIDPA